MAWMRRLCACSAVLLMCTGALLADEPGAAALKASQVKQGMPLTGDMAAEVQKERSAQAGSKLSKQAWMLETNEWKLHVSKEELKPIVRGVACTPPQVPISVSITTDNYGSETTWQITQQGVGVIDSGGPYGNNTTYTTETCVDPGNCYNFTISDAYGDGICCAYGLGSYEVYYDGVLVASGGEFGSSETSTDIGNSGACAVDTSYTCPSNTLSGQAPHETSEDWTAGTSEVNVNGTNYLRADSFAGLGGPICDVHWWGIFGVNPGTGFAPCTDSNPVFDIVVYDDAAGAPGAPVCTYTVTEAGTGTGRIPVAGFEVVRFDVDLPTCCSVVNGWISIQGRGDTSCWFLWWSSGTGDATSYLATDSVPGTDTFDLSMCLTGVALPGACCNPFDTTCTDNVDGQNCLAPNQFYSGQACADLNPPCGGIAGACCDDVEQICVDNVLPAACSGRHAPGETCATMDPQCGLATGACCFSDGRECAQLSLPGCIFEGGAWQGVGADCAACPCVVSCPSGAVPEQDACGADTNPGCNGDPPAFQDIALGDTVCGTIDASTELRDTDWYRFTTTEPMNITIAGKGEFGTDLNLVAGLIETSLAATGSGDCAQGTGNIAPYFLSPACTPASVTTECYPAGTYFVFASVDDFLTLPCGDENDYNLTVTGTPCVLPTGACCERLGACTVGTTFECAASGGTYQGDGTDCGTTACPQPQPGDICELPYDITLPAELPFFNSNGTCGRVNDYADTCLGSYDGGEDIVYELTVTSEVSVQITMNPLATTWSGITLDDACPPDGSCIATVTNSATTVRDLGCKTLAPGTYSIMIDTWPAPDCIDEFELNIVECVPPVGRCCYNDGAACADVTEGECATLGGIWTLGTDCTNPCPIVIGEDCAAATLIPAVPYAANFDNDLYTASAPAGTCDKYLPVGVMQNDGWFVWTSPSDCTAIATVEAGYDAIITVQSDCPPTGTELYCADATDIGGVETITFAATTGTTYYFQIGDTGVSELGGLTAFALDCQADPQGECCTGEACSLTTESVCLGGGGTWALGGDCSPNPCGGGDDCSDPVVVTLNNAALPYMDTNYTCGRGNSYADTCLGSYDGGEDIVYELIVTEAINAEITMNPKTTTWTGIGIDDGTCPLGATGCIATVTNSATTPRVIGCRTYTPGTYYMMMDTWPSPTCIPDFDVTIASCTPPTGACCSDALDCIGNLTEYECVTVNDGTWYLGQDCGTFACPAPPADFCDEATDITALPYVQPNIQSGTMTDDANANPSCDSSTSCTAGVANNGWWYTITPTADCTINVARAGGIDSVASLHTGPDCNSLAQVSGACVDNETTAAFNLTGGTQYWILVSNWSCSSEPTAVVTVTVTGNCEFVCGDLAPPNGDGSVGLQDYLAFIDAFGSCVGDVKYNAGADYDGDGCITWVDYQEWLQCYRSFIGNPTAGPPSGKNPWQVIRRENAPIRNQTGSATPTRN